MAVYSRGKLRGGVAYGYGQIDGKLVACALPEFLYGGPWGEFGQQLANEFFKCRETDGALLIDASGERLNSPNPQEQTCEIIPLDGYETWFQGIDPDARNQVRQAGRKGLTVGSVKRKSFLRLERDTARRQGHSPQEEWTSKLFSFAEKSGTTLGAYKGQRLLAGLVLFKHRTRAYLVKHASLESSFHYRPNHLLYAEAVRWAAKEGCTEINTGGAAYAGLKQFKKSLGSKTHTYYWYAAMK